MPNTSDLPHSTLQKYVSADWRPVTSVFRSHPQESARPKGRESASRLTRRGARVLADSPEEVLNIQIIDLQMASNGLLWLQIAIWSHLEHSESFPAQVETL